MILPQPLTRTGGPTTLTHGYGQPPAVQLALPLKALEPVEYEPEMTLEERFWLFHERNPHVLDALRNLALNLYSRGTRRFGMKALFEMLRYLYHLEVDSTGDSFTLNNNNTAFYARLLMREEPFRTCGFFELRERRAK